MISLCMIVKNEIKFINKCLELIKPYVEEIVVADTGSTDGTLEILEKHGCRVYNFDWCDDYSKARNFVASKSKYDWILVLDADEHICKFEREEIDLLVKSNIGQIRASITAKSFVGNLSQFEIAYVPRFYNKKYYEFKGSIHEELKPKYNFLRKDVKLEIQFNHYGYLSSTIEETGKVEKYKIALLKSLEKEYDPYLVKHLATTYLNSKQYNLAIETADKIINDTSLSDNNYYADAVCTKIKSLRALGELEKALEMQKYFNYCQKNDIYLLLMANIFYLNNLYDTAIDICTVLYKKENLQISRAQVVLELANVYFIKKDYKSALLWYKKLEGVDNSIINRINQCLENL